MMKGAIPSDAEVVYIQLSSKYDNKKSVSQDKVHTPSSLFSKLYEGLEDENLIKKLSTASDIKNNYNFNNLNFNGVLKFIVEVHK